MNLQEALKKYALYVIGCGGEKYISEIVRSVKGDETYLWVRFTAAVAQSQGEDMLLFSTYESVEEEIQSKNATKAKTEFLSRMSHDIRTPMNAIIGLTHLAKQEEDIKVIHGYLDDISTTGDFLLGLINDILDLNKIESGTFVLNEEPYVFKDFLKEIETIIGPLMENKHIQFTVDADEHIPCIQVDRLRFHQIFFNLLSNACKFTPEDGKVEFSVHIIEEKKDYVSLRFILRDNGVGMSKEFQKKMFMPFTQEENSENETQIGTGLGLSIVKKLIDAMHATMVVTSERGQGTEYCIEATLKIAQKTENISNDSNHHISLENSHILLVEDNDMNILVATKILEHEGCQVTVARNGQDAIDQFQKSSRDFFDAILMDVRMPVMDGITATKRIRALERKDGKTVPIIAMTAEAFSEQRKQTLESGMNAHLSKPIAPDELFDMLRQLIHR